MSLFEYMSVAMSLILALTFAEGLRGLHSALQPDRRYGVHATWLFIKLSNPITFWWTTWGYRDIPEYWNIATYTLSLVIPAIMYLQVFSLVGEKPYQVTDWRKHFYKQRKWFFGLNIIIAVLVVILWSNAFITAPARLIPMVGYSFILALSVVGFLSDSSKLHTVVVSITGGFTLIYYGIATFSPVSF